MNKKLLMLFGISLLFLTACDYFENSDTLDSATIEFNLSGLPVIPDTMAFVAWFENEDPAQTDPVILFSGNAANGNLSYKSEKPLRMLQIAQLFWITVERKSLLDTLPPTIPANSRKILGGRFANASCNLGFGENVFSLDNSSAVFNLLTPTDSLNVTPLSGIWFVDSVSQTITAGLELPELYGGWRYEGWVEVNGVLVSTGRFSSPRGVDQLNEYGSTLDPLPFPGEDFLANAPAGLTFPLNLSGAKVYITMEINDNRNAGTSAGIIIFEGTVPNPAQSGVTYTMANANATLPSGDAIIKVDLVE
ncbi:MAG TPA: hypothetical protein VK870_01900 [Ignavibacteriaceae bacterium]|nr:hypothetical protein [Ignavibacteriaceae bacterium]